MAKKKSDMNKGNGNDRHAYIVTAIEACRTSPHAFFTRAAEVCGLTGSLDVDAAVTAVIRSGTHRPVRYTFSKQILEFARTALEQPAVQAYFRERKHHLGA